MNIKPAEGKLGVLCVGLGAVSTTLITGTLMARKGLANPVGSFTQIGKMRVGRGEKKQYKHVGEIVPLTNLNDIVFGAWDVFTDNAYESALYCQVLKREDIEPVRDELERIKPMKACFDPEYAKNLVDPQFGRVPDPAACPIRCGQCQPIPAGTTPRTCARIFKTSRRRTAATA